MRSDWVAWMGEVGLMVRMMDSGGKKGGGGVRGVWMAGKGGAEEETGG